MQHGHSKPTVRNSRLRTSLGRKTKGRLKQSDAIAEKKCRLLSRDIPCLESPNHTPGMPPNSQKLSKEILVITTVPPPPPPPPQYKIFITFTHPPVQVQFSKSKDRQATTPPILARPRSGGHRAPDLKRNCLYNHPIPTPKPRQYKWGWRTARVMLGEGGRETLLCLLLYLG